LSQIERVALVTRDDLSGEELNALIARLRAHGLEVMGPHQGASLSDVSDQSDLTGDAGPLDPSGLPPDVVIALGGDGTVLKALVAYPRSPTLAVNFGSVGFLTQCDRGGLQDALTRLLDGEYRIEERLALEVRYAGRRARCINELVLKSVAHMCELSLWVDGREVHRIKGDGLILGTPTGSTAYLMSTGAPLVTPGVSCVIANPLNEYSFSSRPIILPGDVEVAVQVIASRPHDLVAVIDGGERLPLEEGAEITLKRSPHPTLLITFDERSFFKNLQERLSWGARAR
jgi:NAD+ kinase